MMATPSRYPTNYLCSTTLAHATESTSLIRYRLCDTITAGLSRETLT
jgi:hypothetical protein